MVHARPTTMRVLGVTWMALLWTATSVVDFGVPRLAVADERQVLTQALDPYQSEASLSGILTIAGSETMQPMVTKMATEFMRLHPNVKFAIEGEGSASAIREFVLGISLQRRGDKSREGHDGASKLQVLASSLPLTDKERQAFVSRHGHEPLALPVAMDAVTIYVNVDNPIAGLTLDQIADMFGKRGADRVRTWGQVGLNSGWEKQAIHLYGRDEKSGTREFFIQTVLKGESLKSDIREEPGPASEILAIARDPLGIGYAGAGLNTSFVRAVPLAERAGSAFVPPSVESVVDGSYPLKRALYLYVDPGSKDKLDPVVAAFLKFVNSREGQNVVVRAGFFPLTAAMANKNKDLLKGGSAAALLSRR
jgi:phosphate transport system substrate-binding protein